MPVFYDAINLATNQLESSPNRKLGLQHPVGTEPWGPTEGQIYFNTTGRITLRIYYYNGADWTVRMELPQV